MTALPVNQLFFPSVLVLLLIGIVLYVIVRHRRKGLYKTFDNNFKYNHEDESIAYESPEGELLFLLWVRDLFVS